MEKKTYIRDLYRFEGFRAQATMKPHPEDSNGWIITLDRRQKKQSAQHAEKKTRGIVFWFVKNIENGLCLYCAAYERVYGKKTHEA